MCYHQESCKFNTESVSPKMALIYIGFPNM